MSKKVQVVQKTEADYYQRYQALMAEVEADYASIVLKTGRYWIALWEIYRDRLWSKAKMYRSQEEWLGDLLAQPFGPRRTQFFAVMDRFKQFSDLGLSEAEIGFAVGTGRTAIIYDLPKLIEKGEDGKFHLKTGVSKKLEDNGQTPRDLIMGMAVEQSPSAARQQVSEYANERTVYVHDWDWLDAKTLLAKLVETGGAEPTQVYDLAVTITGLPEGVEVPSGLIKATLARWMGGAAKETP